MSEREFTLFRLNVTVGDLPADAESGADEGGEGEESGRSTAKRVGIAFLAAGAAGAAAVGYLTLRGDGEDEGDGADESERGTGTAEFDAGSSVAAELDAETDRRLDRVRGAFPARLRRSTRDERPDAGAGAGSLIGLLFLLAASAAARYLAAAESEPAAEIEPAAERA